MKDKYIYPFFDKMISKEEKQIFLNQNSKVIWLTGLSGSGKSSIALMLERKLQARNYLTQILDGDNIRSGINSNLSFSDKDRIENIRRIAEISKLFIDCGIITISAFISPTIQIRNLAKKIIGKENIIEVYVNTSIEICEERDTKGLYKKAREGQIQNFTGISAPFEIPLNPDITVFTEGKTVAESTNDLLDFILDKLIK